MLATSKASFHLTVTICYIFLLSAWMMKTVYYYRLIHLLRSSLSASLVAPMTQHFSINDWVFMATTSDLKWSAIWSHSISVIVTIYAWTESSYFFGNGFCQSDHIVFSKQSVLYWLWSGSAHFTIINTLLEPMKFFITNRDVNQDIFNNDSNSCNDNKEQCRQIMYQLHELHWSNALHILSKGWCFLLTHV